MTSSLRGNLIALLLLALAVLAAFALGRFPVAPGDLGRLVWSLVSGEPSGVTTQVETVV
ncbi:MAG: iron ABC transporter permease, partial [Hyphomicrobiales bacterium]